MRLWPLLPVVVLACAVPACSDEPAPAPAAAGGSVGTTSPDLAGVAYKNGATDEAARAVLGISAIVDAARAPVVSEPPADGTTYTRATVPTFAWSSLVAHASPPPSSSPLGGLRREIHAVLGGPRAAHAHGDPNSGKVYFLVFGGGGNERVVRVFTTKETYTPTQAEWDALGAVSGVISLQITAAAVENNELVKGGGPFVAPAPRTFTIAP